MSVTILLWMALLVAVGVTGGILLGLIGIGTTLLAVPVLTMLMPRFGLPPDAAPLSAVATSVSVVAVAAAASVRAHVARGNVLRSLVWVALPGSILGVIVGTFVAQYVPGRLLQLIFAGFLVFIAARMMLARRMAARPLAEAVGDRPAILRLAGVIFGFTGALVGGGGNVFMVPFLRRRNLSMPAAVGTATAISLPVTAVAALLYALAPAPGNGEMLLGLIYLPAFAGLAVGNTIGAPIGARLGGRFRTASLELVFAMMLLALAANMLFI